MSVECWGEPRSAGLPADSRCDLATDGDRVLAGATGSGDREGAGWQWW
jgi:hypothetical protein